MDKFVSRLSDPEQLRTQGHPELIEKIVCAYGLSKTITILIVIIMMIMITMKIMILIMKILI